MDAFGTFHLSDPELTETKRHKTCQQKLVKVLKTSFEFKALNLKLLFHKKAKTDINI